MRNLYDIFECYFNKPERPFVLATLFSVDGSHVYHPGALLALAEDGTTYGSISAGCLEDDIRSHATALFQSGGSKMIHYCPEEVSDNVLGLGLGCGGSVSVLLERLPDKRDSSHLSYLHRALKQNTSCKSVIHWQKEQKLSPKPPQRAVYANDKLVFDSSNGSAKENSLNGSANTNDTLITVHAPQKLLTIFGNGEITAALQTLAEFLQWRVTTINSKNAHDYVCSKSIDNSITVILTHNDDLEIKLLKELLPSAMSYIGVLGSRSRIARIINTLKQEHPEWSAELWNKLHAPVGIDIGSESAQEIALSIVAEIILTSNSGSGKHLRNSTITQLSRRSRILEHTS